MSVTSVQRDDDARTLTVAARFDAPAERVWAMWDDPRKLERWWGPPGYPATMVDHDLSPGGAVRYYMTSPEGERHWGWWRVIAVDAPNSLEFEDGFADGEGRPNPDMPVIMIKVTLGEIAGVGTDMVIESTFASAEAMEQLVSMGMVEGITAAIEQIPAILAGTPV